MKKNLLPVLVLLSACALGASNAFAGDDAGDIISKLQRKYDSIRDVSITFRQDVQFGVTKAEQSFSGKLLMKKGNRYRIEMDQQTIVTDGKSVWSFNKPNNQVLIDNFKENPASFSPDKVLVNVPNNYSSTVIGKERLGSQEATVLKLIPKNPTSSLKWMKVWVDTDELLMKKIQMLETSDNLMTYVVTDIKLNPGLADSQFQFEPPTGVEVIDLR
ncbi:MAG: outer membrane lipoprotein chaperone LolA [Ignavibacteria bacterium]|nr:outer membrane lipoprotein chaperone LolA [Ignavibacteria bacterium]MBI3766843.1 outer membrane lipoprotein chaperone LolA [Ignavibacteriales bacterium]